MINNIYRYTELGDALITTLNDLDAAFKYNFKYKEAVLRKFDELFYKNILAEFDKQSKINPSLITLTGNEHEFRVNDLTCKFILKNTKIKFDYDDINTNFLKVLLCNLNEHNRKQKRKRR